MHTRLSWLLGVLSVACIAGAVLTAAFLLGYYAPGAIVIAAVIGIVVGAPVGVWLSRRIKRRDPDWSV